jgi:hypothetical protein
LPAATILVTVAGAKGHIADEVLLRAALVVIGAAQELPFLRAIARLLALPLLATLLVIALPLARVLPGFGFIVANHRYRAEPDSGAKSGPEQAATRAFLADVTDQPIECRTVHGFLPISAARWRRLCRRRASRLVFNSGRPRMRAQGFGCDHAHAPL